jgi:hypothetical protein
MEDRVKKNILIIIALMISITAYAGSFTQTMRFSEHDLSFETVDDYTIVHLKGAAMHQVTGAPVVPVAVFNVLVPANATVTDMRVLSATEQALDGKFVLLPGQEPRPISYQGEIAFTEPDNLIYNSGTVYPEKLVDYSSTGTKSGYRIASFGVFPLRYTPLENKLSLVTEITIEINYTESSAQQITEKQKQIFSQAVQTLVTNPEDLNRFAPMTSAADDYEIDCIIITNDALAGDFTPLVAWHNQKGFRTEVKSTSVISSSYAGRDLQEKIRNFIIDYFNNRGLKWVILGGDHAIIPSRRARSVVGTSTGNIPSDLYYADLQWSWDGNNNSIFGEAGYDTVDFFADVFLGRMSVDNSTEIANFINKIFIYEKNPDTTYLKKVLLPAAYLWSNYNSMLSQDSIANITPAGWFDCLINQGQNDALRYQVRDSLNSGYALAHLVGHGDDVGIYINNGPQYHANDPQTQTNSNKLVIVNSIACIPGNFEYSDCLAERMTNMPNCAVAVMMNSRYGWGTPPSIGPSEYLDMAFFDMFFTKESTMIGSCFSSSKDHYRYQAESQQVWRWCVYELNLFGDPMMPMWQQTPSSIQISYPDSMLTGGQNITLTVTKDSLPLSDVWVGVYKANEVFKHGKTDLSGQVTLSVNPLTPGMIYFTATGANCYPKQESLMVAQGATQPYIVLKRVTPLQVNLNQTANLSVVIRNSGTAGASNTIGKLRTNNTHITLTDSVSNYGIVLVGDSAFGDAYSFFVDSLTPPGTQIPFTVNITADQGSWNYNFNVMAGTPPIPALLFADHDTGYCLLTVTAQGSIGYTEPNDEAGAGFRYPKAGASALYYSSMLLGNSSSYIVDRFYGQPSTATNTDWVVFESLNFVTPPLFGDEHLRCSYTDAGHASPKNIKVTQNSYMSSNSGYDDFIIMTYDYQNTGSLVVDGLYSGIFADFDIIASASSSDIAGSDASRRLAYMRQAADQNPTVGIKLLSPTTAANLTAIDHDIYVYPTTAMTELMKYQILNGTVSLPQSNRTYDWSIGISEGPFTIQPQGMHRTAYAFVGGSNETELFANADSAQVWFNRYLTGIEEPEEPKVPKFGSFTDFSLSPNPTMSPLRIAYHLHKPGRVLINLYDISGQLKKEIFNGEITNANGMINHELSGLANGVYFVKMETNDNTVMKKFLLVK